MTRPFPLRRPSHQTSVLPIRSSLVAGSGPILALLAATHTVDDLYQGAVPALLPFLAIERHYTYVGLTGITLAATFLSSAVQPAFGVITDKRRMGWLIAAGLLVAGIGVGLSGLGDSYVITWLAIALSGVGVAAYHPEATRTARGVAGNSTQAMSWFSVGGNLGIALGPVLVTPVLLVTGLRGTPLLVIPAVGMAVLLAVRRPWRQAQEANRARQSRRAAAGDLDGQPRRDDWRSFARLTAVVTARSIAYFGVASLLALFVIRRFHEPTAVGSAALTTFVAAGAAGWRTGGAGWPRSGSATPARSRRSSCWPRRPTSRSRSPPRSCPGLPSTCRSRCRSRSGRTTCRTGSEPPAVSRWGWPSRSEGWPPRCSGSWPTGTDRPWHSRPWSRSRCCRSRSLPRCASRVRPWPDDRDQAPMDEPKDGLQAAFRFIHAASQRLKKSACARSIPAITGGCQTMCVTPGSMSVACSRECASSSPDSSSVCRGWTLSSARPWISSSGRVKPAASGSSDVRSYASGCSSG